MPRLTDSHHEAMKWLRERGGDAALDKNGVALAAGESAPIRRSTWNGLRDAGLIEFYNPSGKGYGRLRIVKAEAA